MTETIAVSKLYVNCSFPMRPDAIAASDTWPASARGDGCGPPRGPTLGGAQ